MTPLLDVHGLSVTYGGLHAVEDVSITVGGDAIVGLIGPNGAGKTTMIDALCGFVPHAVGAISLAGQRIDHLPAHERARAGLVRTFQSVELFDDITVRENLLVAAHRPQWWSSFVDAVAPRRSSRSLDVDFALEMVGMESVAEMRPPELAHGQRRLVGVARALASHPKLLLLDEPAAGLDPRETAALGAVLRSLAAADIGVLLVDHDMSLVFDVTDELTVLDLGRVIASGPTATIKEDPTVVAAYLGGGA